MSECFWFSLDCTFVEKGLMMTDQHPNGNQNGSQPSVKEAIKTETLEDVTPARTDHGTSDSLSNDRLHISGQP
ncbi:hypothetical protein GDO78_020975 [Eleutherodactylus coqui]|uniref:Uncharacterized protein n=1 Tax=Eleutherodactylus coqui TaxID=57060 RepID=A0A8J6AYQ8_ELECQ|nr:hypothetical protein GDO78_020975 [Eleutherodactylus coqui]